MTTNKNVKLPVKAVVFDFDGTLAILNVDFGEMRRKIRALINSYGAPQDGLDGLFVLEMVEHGRRIISSLDAASGKSFVERAHEIIRTIEIDGARKGGLFDNVRNMMRELRERGIKVGIVTRNCEAAVSVLYPDIRLESDAVITREHTRLVKPDPEHLYTALRVLEVEPGKSVMIGDHPMDISVGKDIGAFTIGVLSGYADRAMLEETEPDLILENAVDVLKYV